MTRKPFRSSDDKARGLPQSLGHDITDPSVRKRSLRYVRWIDHGILRTFWHNFEKVSDGVYRSNHPDHKRFEAYARMGIKTVLNLRGAGKNPHYLFEAESCAALGLTLKTVHMSARNAPRVDRLLALIEAFKTLERPFLIHCKSGADRTGLAAALYLMVHDGLPLEVAKRQLSFRYLHIRRSSTGILDHFFDVYAARNAQSPIDIVTWIRTEYDADQLTKSFAAKQAALKPWQGWR